VHTLNVVKNNNIALYVLSILSAFLLILSFPYFNIHYLAWFFLVPVFIGCSLAGVSDYVKRLGWYLFGLVFFFTVLYWVIHVTGVGYIALCLYVALYFLLFMYIMDKIIERKRSIILWAPIVWVALEFVRSVLFTGFPWALVGASQVSYLHLIQIASLTGVWGVSFFVVLLNAFIFENVYLGIIKKEGVKSYTTTLLAIVMVGGTYIFGAKELSSEKQDAQYIPFNISVVQPNISQDIKWDKRHKDYINKRFKNLTLELKGENPDLVIWPESCVQGEIRYDQNIYEHVSSITRAIDAPILLGSQDIEFGKEWIFYNSAFLIHPKHKLMGSYKKVHLVPFGEYVPFAERVPFIRKMTPIQIDFHEGDEYTIFGIPQLYKRWKDESGEIKSHIRIIRFATIICFEDIFPGLVREFAAQHIDFIVNITNDAWFKKTSAQMQHAYLSVFRAVENRTYLIRAANTGYSCVIDPYGRIVKDIRDKNGSSLYVPGHFTFPLRSVHKRTVYTQYGNYFPKGCMIITLLGIVIFYVRNRYSRRRR